jgi:AraC-like DNA-binding protein
MKRRIEVAKETLRDGRMSLTDAAAACGFFDQSHLTRVLGKTELSRLSIRYLLKRQNSTTPSLTKLALYSSVS